MRFQAAPLGLQPPGEIVSLSDYRMRHALYRLVLWLLDPFQCVGRHFTACWAALAVQWLGSTCGSTPVLQHLQLLHLLLCQPRCHCCRH